MKTRFSFYAWSVLIFHLAVVLWGALAAHPVLGLPRVRRVLGLSIAGFVTAAILGGFAALGDTLVVSTSLTESMRADFSAFSNIFVRLRILHPLVAGPLGVWLLVLAFRVNTSRRASAVAKRLGGTVAILVLFQFSLGSADIVLKTPIWLQPLHLLAADLLWIAFVLLAAELLPPVRSDACEGWKRIPTKTVDFVSSWM